MQAQGSGMQARRRLKVIEVSGRQFLPTATAGDAIHFTREADGGEAGKGAVPDRDVADGALSRPGSSRSASQSGVCWRAGSGETTTAAVGPPLVLAVARGPVRVRNCYAKRLTDAATRKHRMVIRLTVLHNAGHALNYHPLRFDRGSSPRQDAWQRLEFYTGKEARHTRGNACLGCICSGVP
jgi:hypothetical protein